MGGHGPTQQLSQATVSDAGTPAPKDHPFGRSGSHSGQKVIHGPTRDATGNRWAALPDRELANRRRHSSQMQPSVSGS